MHEQDPDPALVEQVRRRRIHAGQVTAEPADVLSHDRERGKTDGEAVRNVPAVRDQHGLLERNEEPLFLGQPEELLEEVGAHEDVLVDATDVLTSRAACCSVERQDLREGAVLLLSSCNLGRDRHEAGDPRSLGRQRESVANGRLASPVAHHDLHLVEPANLGSGLGRVVESRLEPPDRVALIAVVPGAEDQRQLRPRRAIGLISRLLAGRRISLCALHLTSMGVGSRVHHSQSGQSESGFRVERVLPTGESGADRLAV